MIVVRTPLRISFVGGGSDFPDYYRAHGGAVLSTAIDKYVYVIVKERFDDQIYINYSRKEIVDSVADIQHELVREAMRITGVDRGVEITTLADVPSSGTGLGSSSSITVGLLQALYAYKGVLVTAEQLAQQACEIEIERCKKPIGKQDQFIAAFGGLRVIQFHPDNSVAVQSVDCGEAVRQQLNRELLLFYTDVTRIAGGVLQEQQQNIPARRGELAEMAALVEPGRVCICGGDLVRLGELLHRGWELKKGLASGVSSTWIDGLYAAARDAGATGGKIAGAGGGGFLLLHCPLDRQSMVRAALSELRELPFSLERDGSRVIFNIRP